MNAPSEFIGPSLSLTVTGEGVAIDPVTGAVRIDAGRLTEGLEIAIAATGADGVERRYRLTLAGLAVPPALVAAPGLAGEARIGVAVEVDPGLWSGTPAPGLALQWLLDGAEIPGADGAAYVPVAADDGGVLACRVVATNAAGAAEATTPALTVRHVAPVAAGGLADLVLALGAAPAQVAAAADFAGAGLVFSVSGAGAAIDSATGLVTIAADAPLVDELITVTATNSGGSAASGFRVRVQADAPALLAAPSLAGSGRIGTPVAVDPGSWSGNPAPQTALQWLGDGAEIAGAVAAAYTPGPAEDGMALACRVTATNPAGSAVAETAALTVTQAPPTVVAALPDLVADRGGAALTVEAAAAFAGAALVFTVAGAGAAIDPATGRVEIPTDAALDDRVTVTAANSGGTAEVGFRVTVAAGIPGVAPLLVAAPALGGVARIGQPLAVEPGVWGGVPAPELAFQWCADGAEIAGATAAAYTPVAADDLKAITCRVTATNAAGSAAAVTAALTAVYLAPVARGLLPEEIFDQGSGDQIVEAAADFEGENLGFAVAGAGARIDPATGRVTIPTDTALEDRVTVTASNSGGAAESGFQVTVEAGEGELPEAFPALLSAAHVDMKYVAAAERHGYLGSAAPDHAPGFTYAMSLSSTSGGNPATATPVTPGGTVSRLNAIPDGTTMYLVPFFVRTSDGQAQPALAPGGKTANGHSVRPIPGNESYGEIVMVTGSEATDAPAETGLTPISAGGLAVAIAADIPQFRRGNQGFGSYGVNKAVGPTLSAMALANLTGNNVANARIGQYLATALAGDSCPSAIGGHFAQMKDLWAIGGFAVLRRAPYWDTLTQGQKDRITAIVKAGAIASGFVGSDVRHPPNAAGTSASKALHMDGSSRDGKGGGGNLAAGCPGTILCAMSFFGGPGPLAEIFRTYNHTSFMSELNALGLTNITYTWTRSGSPGASAVQSALAGTWRYFGAPLSDITGILTAGPSLGHPTYKFGALSKTIVSGLNNGAGAALNPAWGKIISGAAGLPNKGAERSMWHELDSTDAKGERSSMHYTTYTAESWIITILALIAGGLFDRSDATLMSVMQRMNRAMIDYSYKCEKGYKSWAQNTSGGNTGGDFGYGYTETSEPGNGLIDQTYALRPREELWHITIKNFLGL